MRDLRCQKLPHLKNRHPHLCWPVSPSDTFRICCVVQYDLVPFAIPEACKELHFVRALLPQRSPPTLLESGTSLVLPWTTHPLEVVLRWYHLWRPSPAHAGQAPKREYHTIEDHFGGGCWLINHSIWPLLSDMEFEMSQLVSKEEKCIDWSGEKIVREGVKNIFGCFLFHRYYPNKSVGCQLSNGFGTDVSEESSNWDLDKGGRMRRFYFLIFIHWG